METNNKHVAAISELCEGLHTDWQTTITDVAQDALYCMTLIDQLHRHHPKGVDIEGLVQLSDMADTLNVIIQYLQPIYENMPKSNPQTIEP